MSLVRRVPETSTFGEGELDAADAGRALSRVGRWQLVRSAFLRFRYGDGFSHARALGLMLSLALFPLAIALVGLAATVHADGIRQVLTETLLRLTPGSSDDTIRRALAQGARTGSGGLAALIVGLAAAVLALTTAMGQVERGANRIYGIERDRPTPRKYLRAFVLALTAGIPMLAGFLVLLAGGPLGGSAARIYHWSPAAHTAYSVLRWPLGVALALLAITLIFRSSPRRRQPGGSWLAVGSALALVLWVALTLLLVLYLANSASVGSTYGPLTGVIALLVWANLTSIALLFGLAMAAQLEAARVGIRQGAPPDPEPPDR
jgi:YihY family inner membrane protein